jgi:hypothetical protein
MRERGYRPVIYNNKEDKSDISWEQMLEDAWEDSLVMNGFTVPY